MALKVFLADDHAVMRDGLRFIIEAEKDMSVVGEAADGRMAVRRVQQFSPDVVIMDIAMPGLNGIEATAQICETCRSSKVLILSMSSSKEHIFRALQSGALGYLLKESAGREVVKAIRTVRTGRHFLSDSITKTVIDDYVHQRRAVSVKSPFEMLSSREREILQLVAEGKSSAQIAGILFLSPKTIETYRSRMMQKLAVRDLAGLVKFAIKHGLTTLDT